MVKNQLVLLKCTRKSIFRLIRRRFLKYENSALKQIRVTKPYYYKINKHSQFLSKIVNITSKKTKYQN